MTIAAPVRSYLERALPSLDASKGKPLTAVLEELRTILSAEHAGETADMESLYLYKVPVLAPGGMACAYPQRLDPVPHNLALNLFPSATEENWKQVVAEQGREVTQSLLRLANWVKVLAEATSSDWLGVYKLVTLGGESHLLKLAYVGAPSRPIFPLTPKWCEVSNNSWVGTNGKARVILVGIDAACCNLCV
jgi:hypothetical protein